MLVTSNFSFSRSVSKRLVRQTRKNQGLFGKGLIMLEERLWGTTFRYQNKKTVRQITYTIHKENVTIFWPCRNGFLGLVCVVKSYPKNVWFMSFLHKGFLKGGYLDFSYLTELKIYIYITEIYMKKQYKSSIIKNHQITNKHFFMVFP